MLDAAANCEITEDEFWDMLPREFYRRLRAYTERRRGEEEARWGHTLLTVNHLRVLIGQNSKRRPKPLSLDDLKRKSNASDPGRAPSKGEYLKDLERIAARSRPRAEA